MANSKPTPPIGIALEAAGWLGLVAALAMAIGIGASGANQITPGENPIPFGWPSVFGCLAAGLVLLGFGAIVRGLHNIEQAIYSSKDHEKQLSR